MELSKETVEKIIVIIKDHLMKSPNSTIKLKDKEIKYSDVVKAIELMDEKEKYEFVKAIVDSILERSY